MGPREERIKQAVGDPMGALFSRWASGLRRIVWCAAQGFVEDRCLLRASALTYTTMLSLVPFLTIAFAILKGLGFQKRLEPLLLEQFTPASQDVIAKIIEYVDRTNAGSLGIAGTLGLVMTAIITMRNMEGAFNRIWKVARGRSLARTVTDYLSVIVIAPLCGLVALSLTTYFNSPAMVEKMESLRILAGFHRLLIRWSPFAILWLAFTACYMLVPNTRVRFRSALLGGAVAGILWQLAQWGYIRYQFGVARYNAIYGALSQLPILLVWIYASWIVVLLGAEVARAHEEAGRSITPRRPEPYPQAMLEVLGAVAARFASGVPPYRLGELLEYLPMEPGLTVACLERLREMGWIAPLEQDSDMVVFQRDPARMSLSELAQENPDERRQGAEASLMERIQAALREALEGRTVAELVHESTSGESGELAVRLGR